MRSAKRNAILGRVSLISRHVWVAPRPVVGRCVDVTNLAHDRFIRLRSTGCNDWIRAPGHGALISALAEQDFDRFW